MLSTEKARRLVKEVTFPGDTDNTYLIAVGGREKRRALLIDHANNEERRIAGAIEIQRIWRGFRTRKRYSSIVRKKRQPSDKYGNFPLLAKRYAAYVKWCLEELGLEPNSESILSFRDYCARVIQRWWRDIRLTVSEKRKILLTRQEAAVRITHAWRRYQDKMVFSCCRKLVTFRQKGDPAALLRTINPLEAKLLDRASGGCVRFRLGGSQFPPSIYYKIFTIQTVVDVCSYSPRDYTAMTSRLLPPSVKHNHDNPQPLQEDTRRGWYERWENNGWRLVSERFFRSKLPDSVTIETSTKRQPFHHSSLQRKEEVERRKKRKRVEWLKKLYSPSEESEDGREPVVREDEVDQLLGWTQSLNYDKYVSDWSQMATSASCDP